MELWYATLRGCLSFARALDNFGVFDETSDVLDFMEKPWKWNREHDAWNSVGCPRFGDPRWLDFIEAMDDL